MSEGTYSVQDARDLFARWENGDATEAEVAGGLWALIESLSTPPTDDVREAVDHAVRAALSPLGIDYVPWWKVVHAVRDSLLAEPMLEVRPRGTVTPPADDVRDRLVIRHVEGNTLGGTVEQVLSTHLAKGWSVESFEVRPRGTVTDGDVADAVDPERTSVERFADAAAEQFRSDMDYDGAEVKRRILTLAHVLAPDHSRTAAECPVCRDDDKVDGL